MLPPSTLKPAKCQQVFLEIEDSLTFGKFFDEMLCNALELSSINCEHVFESLDFLHQVLWHIGHGAWDPMLVTS